MSEAQGLKKRVLSIEEIIKKGKCPACNGRIKDHIFDEGLNSTKKTYRRWKKGGRFGKEMVCLMDANSYLANLLFKKERLGCGRKKEAGRITAVNNQNKGG